MVRTPLLCAVALVVLEAHHHLVLARLTPHLLFPLLLLLLLLLMLAHVLVLVLVLVPVPVPVPMEVPTI